MRASLLDDPTSGVRSLRAKMARAELPARQRVLLLTLNFIPLLHMGTVISLAFVPSSWIWRVLTAAGALYLIPPLLARLMLATCKIPEGSIPVGSRPFFVWWSLLQLQMIFSRVPALEEFLRLFPGLYSLWLRLWRARIGRLTFWSPGTAILDRPFLSVGNDVVFGAGVHINPHVLIKNSLGELELLLGTVKIGDRVRIGGYSLLTAGTEIAGDEDPQAFLVLPPFSTWRNGRRTRTKEYEHVRLRVPR